MASPGGAIERQVTTAVARKALEGLRGEPVRVRVTFTPRGRGTQLVGTRATLG